MYYVIGVLISILVAIAFGFFMAKKMESIGAGKVFASLGFLMAIIILFLIKLIIDKT